LDMTEAVAAERLKTFIARIERLEEDRAGIGADIREVYGEAKSAGFEPKIMRQVVRMRRLDSAERQEQAQLLDLYLTALGEKT